DNWSALLQMMAAKHSELSLIFFGSGDEFDRCEGLAGRWNGPALNFCGRFRPRESAAIMRRASFYLGHDCGAMHLAAAVGIPCVAMFGSFNTPNAWHPMGTKHRVIHNIHGVDKISPADVLAAIEATIAESANRVAPNFKYAESRRAL